MNNFRTRRPGAPPSRTRSRSVTEHWHAWGDDLMRLFWSCIAAASALAAPSRVLAINVRSGVPEGTIAVKLDIVTQYNPSPATEFTPIAIAPFNDGTGRLA